MPDILLAVVGVAGILAIGAIAPNAVQLLKYFPRINGKRRFYPAYVDAAVKRLLDQAFIKLVKENGKTFVRLTEAGENRLLKFRVREKVLKQKKWDGKWRVLIFDIKEYRRGTRDSLRNELINLGFVRLQDSVWINPYECDEVTVLLKANLRIGRDLIYMTVEQLENDKWLRRVFGV